MLKPITDFPSTTKRPDAYALAGFLARRFECGCIIALGCDYPSSLHELGREFAILGIDDEQHIRRCRATYGLGNWIAADPDSLQDLALPASLLARSLIISTGLVERVAQPRALFGAVHRFLQSAPAAIMSGGAPRAAPKPAWDSAMADASRFSLPILQELAASEGLNVAFSGTTIADNLVGPEVAPTLILENYGAPKVQAAPPEFRVTAILSVFNEADIIVPVVRYLLRQGVGVYVMDNWSTDGTYDLLAQIESDLVGLERWPQSGANPVYNLQLALQRKEEIAGRLPADWILHYDADEIRESPWEGVILRDAIYHVDRQGFNAIDFTILECPATDNAYMPGTPPQDHFRLCAFGQHPSHFRQIKAWKNTGGPIDLAGNAGHSVRFAGRRVYPFKFLTRHFPIRSQAHGERKVLLERRPRYAPALRAQGWHVHYDHIVAGQSMLKAPNDLMRIDDSFHEDYLAERLSGIGLRVRGERPPDDQETQPLEPQELLLIQTLGHIDPVNELDETRAVARELAAELRLATHALGEIRTSAAWRFLERIRRLRVVLVPPGSRRERLWYRLLRIILAKSGAKTDYKDWNLRPQ